MTPQDVNLVSSAQQEFVPDSLTPEFEPPPCDRCAKTHDINNIEACRLAHCLASRCACCGLIHADYDFTAKILSGLDGFDCEIYNLDVGKLQMRGNTISLFLSMFRTRYDRRSKI